ncbi:MAG: sugar phosphate isomerase/epimerase [Phycisphaerae bacterium]|nr:sugar phosphate isomerase/epimerase [Phycisphaerae bacterium]
MNLMICMRGEPEQLPFLPEIAELGAGIELGSYGLVGIRSERDWEARFELHRAVRDRFQGTIAVHGPFIGMEYAHPDHLFQEVVRRRLDMTFDVAGKLKASRVVLHSGYSPEIDLFSLQDLWLERSVDFWRQEIRRWADAGVEVVLENDTERSPDLPVRLVNGVNSPSLGLCMDIGHQHMFSELDAPEWVRWMGMRLSHVHLHDNDRTGDHHWPIGRGTIDFEPFYAAMMQHVPQATLSLEVTAAMEARMHDLRELVSRFASRGQSPNPASEG